MTVDLIRLTDGPREVAVLVYAARRPRSIAIVAGHGYSSSKQNLDALCSFLASHGFAVYSIDFPGHKLGASGGVLHGVEDLVAAMRSTIARARADGFATVYVLGHSMGAMTALITSSRDPSLAGVISIATGLGRPAALQALEAKGTVDLRSSYVEGATLAAIVTDADPLLREAVPALRHRPVLFIAAERDMMVARSSVEALAALAGAEHAIVSVASDHTYAGENSRSAVLAWLNSRHPRAAGPLAAMAAEVSP